MDEGRPVCGVGEIQWRVDVSHRVGTDRSKVRALIGKAASHAIASTAKGKHLQTLERQVGKFSVPSRSDGKRSPGMGPALKPAKEKDKPNPANILHGTG